MNKRPYLLGILSGIAIGTSFIPFPPWATLFAFAPLWWCWLRESNFKIIFISGWLTQFTLTLIGFNWVAFVAHEFGHLPWPVAILIGILHAAIANLYIPIVGVLWWHLKKRLHLGSAWQLLLLAMLSALGEEFFPTIFKWHFGYTYFWSDWPIFQWADLVGFKGLSLFTHLGSACVVLGLSNWRSLINWTPLALLIAVFVAGNLTGRQHGQEIPVGTQSLRILIVQANIGNLEKQHVLHHSQFRQKILEQYLELAKTRLGDPNNKIDVMIWPETAYPDTMGPQFRFSFYFRMLRLFLQENQIAFWGGAYSETLDTGQTTNSFFVIGKNGDFVGAPYFKTHLLAFGEYFPGGQQFPFLKNLVPSIGDFARGHGPTTLQYNDIHIGPQICYEGLFPEFSRQLADLGADIIVNVTNDSWFGKWQEPYQHLYMTLSRAIEFRRPVVRSTNTGISTVVLRNGDILERSPLHEPWTGVYNIQFEPNSAPTFYQKYFWLTTYLAVGLVLVIVVIGRIKSGKPRLEPRS